MTRLVVVLSALALAGCYDSLVGGSCADGFVVIGGTCQRGHDASAGGDAGVDPDAARVDGGRRPDGGPRSDGGPTADGGPTIDGGPIADGGPIIDGGTQPDAFACTPPLFACSMVCVDLQTDPDNCGSCGNVCASGICSAGLCQGIVAGHIVLIGHDYKTHHASAVRVLTNALDLADGGSVRLGVWRGSADGGHAQWANTAIADASAFVGRSVDRVDLTKLPSQETDRRVVVIMPQVGDGALAEQAGRDWATSAQAFVHGGGIIIALGGEGTVTQRVLVGAGLSDAIVAGVATGQDLTIVAPADAVASGVTSPYHADTSTVSYTVGRGVVVVRTPGGDAVVVDEAIP